MSRDEAVRRGLPFEVNEDQDTLEKTSARRRAIAKSEITWTKETLKKSAPLRKRLFLEDVKRQAIEAGIYGTTPVPEPPRVITRKSNVTSINKKAWDEIKPCAPTWNRQDNINAV